MEVECVRLDKALLPYFEGLLLPQTAALLWAGQDEVEAVGALSAGEPCGAAAVRRGADAAELLSMYVAEPLRRKGVGSLLLLLLMEHCLAGGCSGLEADYVLEGEARASLEGFLRANGFVGEERASIVYQFEAKEFLDLPLIAAAFRSGFRPAAQVRPLDTLPQEALRALEEDGEIPGYLRPGRFVQDMLPPLSLCWLEGDRPAAYLICTQGQGGSIVLAAAVSRSGAPAEAFLRLLQAALARAFRVWGEELTIYVSAVTEDAQRLCQALSRGRGRKMEEIRSRCQFEDGSPSL